MRHFFSRQSWVNQEIDLGEFSHIIRPSLFCLAIFVLSLMGIAYNVRLWTCVDDVGLSCVSHKTPYWDFLNLWQGGNLAVSGSLEILFDAGEWRALLRETYSAALPDSEWSYPPTMLLFGATLSFLPLPVAYWVFTLGGILALFAALASLRTIPLWICALVGLSPLVLQNALLGQNGAYTSALLIGALSMAPRRPLMAGFLAGLLVIKPHLGILIPLAWVFAGYWRAAFAAGVTVAAMILLTIVAFGLEAWTGFMNVTTPMMVSILEAPFPQDYHTQAFTMFIVARAFGADLALAYGVQLFSAVMAIAVTIWLWRSSCSLGHTDKVLITAMLAPLVTPYAYSYDAISVMVAAVWYAWKLRPSYITNILLFLTVMAFNFFHIFNYYGYPFMVFVPVGLSIWVVYSHSKSTRKVI